MENIWQCLAAIYYGAYSSVVEQRIVDSLARVRFPLCTLDRSDCTAVASAVIALGNDGLFFGVPVPSAVRTWRRVAQRATVVAAMSPDRSPRAIRAKIKAILHREVPVSTCLLGGVLVVVAYLYVPTVRTCRSDVKLHPYVGATDIECSQPEFVLRCSTASVYRLATGSEEVLCRTWRGRAVRVVDDAKRQRAACQDSLGWFAGYKPDRGCYCEPHSIERDGFCVPTDQWCQERFGTGAVAIVSAEADRFSCGCGTGYTLSDGTLRCEPSTGSGPGASPTLFPLRP